MPSRTVSLLATLVIAVAYAAPVTPAQAAPLPRSTGSSITLPRDAFVRAARLPAGIALGSRSLAVEIDSAELDAFERDGAGTLRLPLRDGRVLELELTRFELFTPEATITATGDDGPRPIDARTSFYHGTVAGLPGSRVVITRSPLGVMGAVQTADARYEIAPVGSDAGGSVHVVADTRDLAAGDRRFECGSEDRIAEPRTPGAERRDPERFAPLAAGRLRCELAVDCDWEFYSVKFGGNLGNATSYALTLLAIVSDIYEAQIDVELRLSYFNLWVTSGDPYTANNTSNQLPEFQIWWSQNRTGVSRHLAHLISGRSLGGGIAYLTALCNPAIAYGVSQLDAFYSYPTSTATWDVMVLAHEMGHNFSSPHTQSCFWQTSGYAAPGALLDSCFTAEGTCYSGPTGILPPDKGTIMSYCHLLAGVAAGMRLDFHTACRTEMRNHAEACLPDAPFDAELVLAHTVNGDLVNLSWNASPAPGVLHYDVYRSPLSLALAPDLVGSTASTTLQDTAGIGTYHYRVRAVRASDHSGYSNEVQAPVCLLQSQGLFGPGTQTTTPVVADFNEDGIPDVAVANGISTGFVYVLLGTGGGAFSAPVAHGVGRFPVQMIAGDFDEDGVTDLVTVSKQAAGGLTFLFGNGAGGQGDGTFADSLMIPLGQEPATLVSEDFNEDGIADLAVGRSANSLLSILIGQGANGTGNGTYVADSTTYSVTIRPVSMVSGDFNEDGIFDLAVLGSLNGQISILLGLGSGGQGNGKFADPVSYSSGGGITALVSGDFDADGITDLATIQRASVGNLGLLFGQGSAGVGDGTFGLPVVVPAGDVMTDLATGDLNGDGVTDLALTNGNASHLVLLLGHSVAGVADGTFGSPVPFTVGDSPLALVHADMNGDENPDALMTYLAGAQTVGTYSAPCPPRASTAIALLSPNGGENWGIISEQPITWTKGPGILAVNLDVDRGDGRWERIASNLTGTSFTWTVTGPSTDSASVQVRVSDATAEGRQDESDLKFRIGPDIRLDVPATANTLGIHRVYPNPGRGDVWVGFSLPLEGPATLDVMDIAGRRVRSLEVGSRGRGSHLVRLGGNGSLQSGVYWVRLSQAGRSVIAKAAVLK